MHSLIRSVALAVVAILLLVAATAFFGLPSPSGGNEPPAQQMTDYKNATYSIENRPVTLVNGLSIVEPQADSAWKITTKYFGNDAVGDLNADGTADVAFILTQDSGGSGNGYYVVAALKTESGYQGTNAIFLGDRIAPQSTEIRGGQLIVNYADQSPSEPMTAQPLLGVSKYLRVERGVLVEITANPAP